MWGPHWLLMPRGPTHNGSIKSALNLPFPQLLLDWLRSGLQWNQLIHWNEHKMFSTTTPICEVKLFSSDFYIWTRRLVVLMRFIAILLLQLEGWLMTTYVQSRGRWPEISEGRPSLEQWGGSTATLSNSCATLSLITWRPAAHHGDK